MELDIFAYKMTFLEHTSVKFSKTLDKMLQKWHFFNKSSLKQGQFLPLELPNRGV